MAVSKNNKNITIETYTLSENDPFMCKDQLTYFRLKLEKWRSEVMIDAEKTRQTLQKNNTPEADVADRASTETERSLELRTRDRQRKLLAKINGSLARIKEGSYGYCIETGEPIGLKRLDARPIALLSIQAQERHEKHERSHRDD
ncbi:MAG: RNA polymerase-binding protein DksA [Pelagibacterales bacterium]|jgi:DnaK suppressor protein|nr:RNA polymerase-binding protein DksA [Pelagibacterales bacterium]|tara:strand:+ start:486 stop:920 length:435 start_codon:yes stop_codon:yes gene_type:complete